MEQKRIGNLTFERNDDGYEVVSCDKDATSVIIPSDIEGTPVTGIANLAFENCKMLEEVVFPSTEDLYENGVGFEIGGNAFMGCTALKSVEIPEAVSTIGRGAFYHCHALESVVLPDRCYVAPYAFADCRSLTAVTPTHCISEGIFSCCESLKDIPLLPGTEEIDEEAFEECDSLTEITIPASVKRIGPQAFSRCSNLKRVTFESPDGWQSYYKYKDAYFDLHLDDPEKNARILSAMDFDDGCGGWKKKAPSTKKRSVKIETIVFDLDGTLLDTLTDIHISVNYALEKMGLSMRTIDEIRSFLGNGTRYLLEKALPDDAKHRIDEITEIYMEHYNAHKADHTAPYDGIIEMLHAVKAAGYRTAIVSNKFDSAVQELKNNTFTGLIDFALGEGNGIKVKPDPEGVWLAMEKIGATKQNCVYVGDTEVDMLTAVKAALPCISVTWGFRDRKWLKAFGAEHIIDSPEELLSAIESIE